MLRLIIFYFILTFNAHAQDIQADRYTLIDPTSTPEQRFPLIEIKSVSIPEKVIGNAHAIDIVLNGTGYAQASHSHRSLADKALIGKPLPAINRKLVNMTVHEMLQAIAGVGHVVIVDPINRLIAFERDHAFD